MNSLDIAPEYMGFFYSTEFFLFDISWFSRVSICIAMLRLFAAK